jgi:dihydrofolate reductase
MEEGMTTVNAILAMDDKYGIGKDGKLPWPHNAADMKWFRESTNKGIVVMGRKTWESIGAKKLPGRINIVVSSSNVEGEPDGKYSGDIYALIKALKIEYPDRKIWIIGGANIYEQALPFCDNIHLTHIPGDYDCDAFVPMDRFLDGYLPMAKKEQDGITFSIWSRI